MSFAKDYFKTKDQNNLKIELDPRFSRQKQTYEIGILSVTQFSNYFTNKQTHTHMTKKCLYPKTYSRTTLKLVQENARIVK